MRMLQSFARWTFLTFTFVGMPGEQPALAKGGNQVVADKERGFAFNVPSTWDQQRNTMGASVIALSPKEGNKDTFRENVNVVVEDLTSPMNAKEYFTASQSLIKKAFTEFKLEKTGQSKIGAHDFYWSIFSHRIGTIKARVLQYVTVAGNKAFVVTASAQPDTFHKYKGEFESIINTFRIDPKGVNKAPASK